jgi:hypothetical protein
MERKQYVKELPNEEIELHGETETYQYPVSSITAMQVSPLDHPFVEAKETSYWVLRVCIHASECTPEERMIFTSPTEEGVEQIRAEINRIRFREHDRGHNPGFLTRILKVIKGV